jgi:hypothetical protein
VVNCRIVKSEGAAHASEGPQYFGSGVAAAQAVSAETPRLTPCQVIRKVIHRQLDAHDGGRVQYGKLVESNFRVYAVYDFDVHEEEKISQRAITSAASSF